MDALQVAEEHGVAVSHLAVARELSRQRLATARDELATLAEQFSRTDVVAFGSLARQEMTSESDFDYLVITTGLPAKGTTDTLLDAADGLRQTWSVAEGHLGDTRPPGPTGLFGAAIGAFDIVEGIGLQRDSNHSLTRRMLLLEESTSLANPNVRNHIVNEVLSRYLDDSTAKKSGPPRFLLNDVLRYWHTLTVDYQAKITARRGPSPLRLAKLRISRKITYAGTIMAILLCNKEGMHRATPEELFPVLDLPPIDRLLLGYTDAPQNIQRNMMDVITSLDWFIENSSSQEWRQSMESSEHPTEKERQAQKVNFTEMKVRAKQLQSSLERIFYDWEVIADDSRRLLTF